MKTAPTMQRIITAILTQHGLTLKPELCLCLRLSLPGFMPLVIEMPMRGMVSVAHYYSQGGDLVADPDVVFLVGADGWAPVEIQQPFGYQNTINDPAGQRDLAEFAEFWAKNLEDQGWLEYGRVERSQAGTEAEEAAEAEAGA